MEIKKLWKVFIILFLVILVIFNWNEVSWIFNYRAVSGLLSDFFKKSDKEIQKDDRDDYYEGEEDKSSSSSFATALVKEDSLEIPKIEVSAPLIFVEDIDKVYKTLDNGVVHYPDSVLPGEKGQTIILGHSAPPNWPDIKYDDVFSRLNELEEGDEVFVYFDHREYVYSVIKKIFLEKGEEVPENALTNSDNMLVLISCWPPGKDIRRIAVEAKLKTE
ncbi:MAG: sortase [Candidatus Nealsonbacteria bacterium]|nr:sortase [Candidatus Nealsonbacteria bacterium]